MRASPVRETASTPVPLPSIEHVGRFAAKRDVSHHTHPGPELVFVTEAACHCEAGTGGWLPGRKGTMFVMPADVPHAQRNLGFTRTTYVVFFAPPSLFDTAMRTIQVPVGDPLEAWMEQLCDLAMENDPAESATAGALLLVCLTRLSTLENRVQARKALHPTVARAVAHLEAHLTAAFRAEEVARSAGASVSHMNALFRKHLGRSPLRYQQERRLRRAQSLLLGPYARVNEVAAACGYDDTNYFVRLFTREFGAPPGAWRKRQAAPGRR